MLNKKKNIKLISEKQQYNYKSHSADVVFKTQSDCV